MKTYSLLRTRNISDKTDNTTGTISPSRISRRKCTGLTRNRTLMSTLATKSPFLVNYLLTVRCPPSAGERHVPDPSAQCHQNRPLHAHLLPWHLPCPLLITTSCLPPQQSQCQLCSPSKSKAPPPSTCPLPPQTTSSIPTPSQSHPCPRHPRPPAKIYQSIQGLRS